MFKHKVLFRQLLLLNLFAILMLTGGPVVSKALAFNSSTYMAMLCHTKVIDKNNRPIGHSPINNKHHLTMSQCGYCDLVYYSPILTVHSPNFEQTISYLFITANLYIVDFRSPSYHHALGRAPPTFTI